jgi:hypothetical protein
MDIPEIYKKEGDKHFYTEYNAFLNAINSKADKSALATEITARLANEQQFQIAFQTKVNKADYAVDLETLRDEDSRLQTLIDTLSGGEAPDLSAYLTKTAATATYQPKGNYLTTVAWTDVSGKPTLFNGDYANLTNKPVIPSIAGLATESFVTSQGYLKTIPAISYNDLTNKPGLFSGSYNDLTDKPDLGGGNVDLTPYLTISSAASTYQPKGTYLTAVTWTDVSGKPSLFSGSYTDLTNKPSIPSIAGLATETFVNSQGFIKSVAYADITGKPALFSGSYSDLTNKPTIPSISGLASEEYVTSRGYLTSLPVIDYSIIQNTPVIPDVPTDLIVDDLVNSQYLPTIDLMQYFDSSQFSIVNDKITFMGAGTIPTPSAPTNGVVDDTNNTFGFTPRSGVPIGNYEYQLGSGTITTVTVNPIQVGNAAYSVGTVKVREKAISGISNASNWLTNSTAFTSTVLDGIQPYTEWDTQGLSTVIIQDSNTVVYDGGLENGYPGYGQIWGELNSSSGVPFILQQDMPTNISAGGMLILDSTDGDGNQNMDIVAYWAGDSSNGRWVVRVAGNNYDDYQSFNPSGLTPKLRIRGTGVNVFIETTTDGVTWVNKLPSVEVLQKPLFYVKTFFSQAGKIQNVMHLGFSA